MKYLYRKIMNKCTPQCSPTVFLNLIYYSLKFNAKISFSIIIKVLESVLTANEFEPQSQYYVSFRINSVTEVSTMTRCMSLHIWIEVSVAVKRMYVNNSNCDS